MYHEDDDFGDEQLNIDGGDSSDDDSRYYEKKAHQKPTMPTSQPPMPTLQPPMPTSQPPMPNSQPKNVDATAGGLDNEDCCRVVEQLEYYLSDRNLNRPDPIFALEHHGTIPTFRLYMCKSPKLASLKPFFIRTSSAPEGYSYDLSPEGLEILRSALRRSTTLYLDRSTIRRWKPWHKTVAQTTQGHLLHPCHNRCGLGDACEYALLPRNACLAYLSWRGCHDANCRFQHIRGGYQPRSYQGRGGRGAAKRGGKK